MNIFQNLNLKTVKMKRDLYRFAKARRDKEYYSTGIDGWWTQNPKSKWIITK